MRPAPLSVCVVSFRHPALLTRCIDSVRRHLPHARVHVLDNASADSPQIRRLASSYPDVNWVFNDSNTGFAAGANTLVDLAGRDDVLLLNPDAEMKGDLAATLRAARQPRVAAVAPETQQDVPEPGSRPWDVAHKKPALVRSVVAHSGYSAKLRGLPLSDLYRKRPSEVSGYLTGACLLITRRAWDDVGGFDEGYFLYGEEVEWQQRAIARGWTVHLAHEGSSSSVVHKAGGTTADSPRLTRRSLDLLKANQAKLLGDLYGPRRRDAFIVLSTLLDSVQRSKRRIRERSEDAITPVVVTSNTLNIGGAERQRVLLANGLSSDRDVAVTCLQELGPLVAELDPAVRVVRRPWWLPAVGTSDTTVLVTGTTRTELGFGRLWRKSHRRGAWLVAVHNPPRKTGPTFGRLQARAISRADGVVALGDEHWAQLTAVQRLHDRVFHIPNGVPSGIARSLSPSRRLRLVVLSRITHEKNHPALFRALAGLDQFDWTLDVYGDGPQRDEFRRGVPQNIADRVYWRGWARSADAALANADVLCVPSAHEAQPLVILEAMARKVPVVASAVCAVPAMLRGGACGVLVPSAAVADWRDALRAVLEERVDLAALASEAFDEWERTYSVDTMVGGYRQAVDRVVGVPRPRGGDVR